MNLTSDHRRSHYRRRRVRPGRRRGTTLLETVIAVGVLGAGLALSAQVMFWVGAERRENQRRQLALQEAANCLEALRALPWESLNDEHLSELDLSPEAQQSLPAGKLNVDVAPVAGEENARRLRIEVHWQGHGGQPAAPVRLSAWRWQSIRGGD